ncbi:MAG: hypothetical protein GXC72_00825 [Chitinophagaceae bacterium]|nr:hypothetical protein [Chitinophagaceae bacterium]
MGLTTFNNVKAAEVQILLDQLWAEPSTSKSYGVKAHALKAVLENQTAVLTELENPDQKRDVSVKWVDFCGDTSADGQYADNCTPAAGDEGTAKKQDYALDVFITDSYSVAQEELESAVVSYDQIVATGLAAKIKNIIERFNAKVVAAIAANKGTNPFPGAYSYDNVTKDTTVVGADYGVKKLYPYFMQVSEMNRSQSVYLLDGGNLFQDYYIAKKTVANDNGKAEASMYDDIPFRHDMAGFAANALSANSFLIDKGSLAVANRAKFPSLQKLAGMKDGGWIHTSNGNIMRYSIPVNIPDLMPMMFISQNALKKQQLLIDVQHSVVCTEGGLLLPTWQLKLRAGVFANPIRCNAGNTGILSFVKAAE